LPKIIYVGHPTVSELRQSCRPGTIHKLSAQR
jgi:hypothetical protein